MPARLLILLVFALPGACSRSSTPDPATSLPPAPPAVKEKLAASLTAARQFAQHPWRDIRPLNSDGTVSGYVEISRGSSTKWEFRIPLNRLEVDRTVPAELGGYPINYGFLPRTISYDGDPADVLVVGPPIDHGSIVKGRIVALMQMMDDGVLDSKVVIAPVDDGGEPQETLHASDRERLERFFNSYKRHEGKATRITGWGSDADARAFLDTTAGFFAAAR